MQNEVLWIILMLLSFVGITLAYRFFGEVGLYAWYGVSMIIANIQVILPVQLFGLVTALGNIIYGSTFLATDILCENHGKKAAQRAIWIGFFMLVFVTIIMQVSINFNPYTEEDPEGFAMLTGEALKTIFGILPRIAFASIVAYLVSQNFDVWFYSRLKKLKTRLWVRNNISTMVSQLIDNVLFTWIAFVGFFGILGFDQVFSWSIILQIFITSYILKWIVAALDTPFLYLAKRLKN